MYISINEHFTNSVTVCVKVTVTNETRIRKQHKAMLLTQLVYKLWCAGSPVQSSTTSLPLYHPSSNL